MKQLFTFCSALMLTLICSPIWAKNPVDLIGTSVSFNGSLGYLDYGSGKEVFIPITLAFSQSADKKHLIVDKVFTDPGYKVYSLSVLKLDLVNKLVTETTFSDKSNLAQTYTILEFDFHSHRDWTLTRQTLKQDNDQDARVVITETMTEQGFNSETRVDYMATPANENLKRNWVDAALVASTK